jgi:hypothetical protein
MEDLFHSAPGNRPLRSKGLISVALCLLRWNRETLGNLFFIGLGSSPSKISDGRPRPRVKHFGLFEPEGRVPEMYRGRKSPA